MSYLENLVLIAATHRWLNTDELSKLYTDIEDTYRKILQKFNIDELFILQTCHRVEYYTYSRDNIDYTYKDIICEVYRNDEYLKYFKIFKGLEVVEHILKVAAGLDSAIIGECDVLGQLEKAYDYALRNRYIRDILKLIIERSIRFGKYVRTVTGISRGIHGFGSLIVQLLKRLYEDLENTKILIVGAGDLGSTIAKELYDKNSRNVVILNRTIDKARQIAEKLGYKYDKLDIDTLIRYMENSDVTILAISSEKPIITKEIIKKLRKKPLIIDLGVPRLVEKDIEAPVIYFEDLIKLAEKYNRDKLEEVKKVEEMLKQELKNISIEIEKKELKKLVGKYVEFAYNIARKELEKAVKEGLVEDRQIEKLDIVIRSITSKIVRPIIKTLEENIQQDTQKIKQILIEIIQNIEKEFTKEKTYKTVKT